MYIEREFLLTKLNFSVPLISAGRIWALGFPPPNGFVRQSAFNIAELSAGVITAGLATIRLIVSRHFPSRSLETLPRRDIEGSQGRHGPPSFGLSKISSNYSSRATHESQLSSRKASDAGLFDAGGFGKAPGRPNQLSMGTSATVTTGRYNRPMNEGGAEFLKEFGITVETNWEVTETVIEVK